MPTNGFAASVKALLGFSTYRNDATTIGVRLESDQVISVRDALGGQVSPIISSQTRWYIRDIEDAQHSADSGDLAQAARLWRACKTDGCVAGALSQRTGTLLSVPQRWRGDEAIISDLQLGNESVRSTFGEMCPASELALLDSDGIGLGVGVGILEPVPGRDFPVLIRLDPEFLYYWWAKNRWFYRSVAGLIEVNPGDGRWVLHVPGGRLNPWTQGSYRSVGRAFIQKEHALMADMNWQSKLANPARVAVAPSGATEEQQQTFWRRVLQWGINTVFGLKPGWDIKLLESNGRGSESFDRAITRAERDIIIAILGQMVTTDGGAGFSNSNVQQSIRHDLIRGDAAALAYTINTQILPAFVLNRYGEQALERSPQIEFVVDEPRNLLNEANTLVAAMSALSQLVDLADRKGLEPDYQELLLKFGVRQRNDLNNDGVADVRRLPRRPERAA